MALIYFITHPEVAIDPEIAITNWPLSERGKQRTQKLLTQPWISSITKVFSSTERKAVETAQILASYLQLPVTQIFGLGEMDRSSTQYLPKDEFEKVVDEFFAQPDQSVRGWETAQAAQKRIMSALEIIEQTCNPSDVIAVVSHGGVGALVLATLKKESVSRSFDQPGEGGGNFFIFDSLTKESISEWQSFEGTR